MPDVEKSYEATLAQMKDELGIAQQLTQHPMWKIYCQMLNEQIDHRRDTLELQAAEATQDTLVQHQYMLGEIGALRLAIKWLASHIETLQEAIELVELAEKEDDPDGTT